MKLFFIGAICGYLFCVLMIYILIKNRKNL